LAVIILWRVIVSVMNTVTYRQPSAADAESIFQLLSKLYHDDAGDGLQDMLAQFLGDQSYFTLVACRQDGKLAGFLAGTTRLEPDFECRAGLIDQLYVEKDAREQGAVKAMVDQFSVWCRERGCKGVLVPAGREGLYEPLGFEKSLVRRYWKELA